MRPALASILLVFTFIVNVVCNDYPTIIFPTQVNPVFIEKEDIPVGTTLTSITAVDLDGPEELIFELNSGPVVRLSEPRGDSVNGRTVDVIINQELDRDFTPTSRETIIITVYDYDKDVQDDGNKIVIQLTLYITDVNDESPTFGQRTGRYEIDVKEDVSPGTVVINITATDPDTGDGGDFDFRMIVANEADRLEPYVQDFIIDPDSGQVFVNKQLDANENDYYIYRILAEDSGTPPQTGTANLYITITDVQNTPPYFTNLPYSQQIYENATTDFSVLRVSAIDGDKGNRNDITYSMVSGDTSFFNLDATSGWITIKSPLDRDTQEVRERGGVYTLTVKATEQDTTQDISQITATTLVTITVLDVNDNAPKFNSPRYEATILEQMQEGVPITFTGPGQVAFMNASDIDQGKNSIFNLTLEKDGLPYTDFATLPKKVFSESSILIQVQNKSALDYEKATSITFVIVARETDTAEARSSSATVTVNIQDLNDNSPIFVPDVYPPANVSEDAKIGREILTLKATDLDTGTFGKITYHIRGSNTVFKVNESSGVITLAETLDRETVDSYSLTAEARDGGGLTDIINIDIVVDDVNDNPPLFRREEYFGTLPEDGTTFLRGNLIVEAVDDDKPGTPNSKVMYRIVQASAGLTDKFAVNQTTGLVTLVDKIDYESLPVTLNGRVILEVEAYDLGVPEQSSVVNVTVEIEDVNDVTPEFNQSLYTASILESAQPDTIITQVFASDGDSAVPNNDFLYRIDTGASDKFRINFRSGEISVEQGAILDREDKSEYVLNISATDRGAVSRTGYCQVTITIDDVNDEPPVFDPSIVPVSVRENATRDNQVVCMTASDPDTNPSLSYSIVPNSVTGHDENGNTVNVTATGVKDYFKIDSTTGCIMVNTDLDRETVETMMLKVMVQDNNAENGVTQTATAQLDITIEDFNDNAPEFQPNDTYILRVSEGRDPASDSEILRLETRDRDIDQAATFEMGINVDDSFAVGETTGSLSLKKALDREKNENLEITVIAKDKINPIQSSTATILISVSDVNDNNPYFKPYNTTYSVAEDAAINMTIATFTAMDNDLEEFANIFYTFDVVNDDSKLQINRNTGTISVAKTLDRETKDSYTLYVIAADNPSDPTNRRTNQTKTITVHVEDVNDNQPYFTNVGPSLQRMSVKKRASVDTLVDSVSAEDNDIGDNARLDFSLTADDTVKNLFIIETVSRKIGGVDKYFGEIKVNGDLTGQVGEFIFNVTVTDRGTPQKSADISIIIEVEDENIFKPEFVFPEGPVFTYSWPENEPTGSSVIKIIATDKDYGRNAEISYSIPEEGDYQSFQINPQTGLIRNLEVLDRETKPRYQDYGRNAEISYSIPEERDYQSFQINPQTGLIRNLEVLDRETKPRYQDYGRNAKISYSIPEVGDYQSFQINPQTGLIRNLEVLDRQTKTRYQIKIKAEDNGNPVLDRTLTLIIMLLDTNDNPPVFPRGSEFTPFRAYIEEERTYNQSTASVAVATDPDEGENNITCYFIIGGDEQGLTHFKLSREGSLMLTSQLDRDSLEESAVNLVILATPDCTLNVSRSLRPALFPPTDYYTNRSILWVEVEITDINDNPPEFAQSVLTLGVTRDTGYATSLINLKDLVTDKDERINCTFQALKIEQFVQNKVVEPFKVFPNGSVFTNTFFRSDMYGYFLIYIQAIEESDIGPPFVVNATLRISLINDDQRVKVVFRNSPENVRAFQVAFAQKLQNTTGYRIVADRILTHENKFGVPEVNKTDMFIHGEDLKTNETISASELLRVIDANAEALLELRYQYKVLEIVPVVVAAEEEDLENVFKMALILVAIVLGLLCCAIAIVFYISREQYKRKLKAATAMAYGSSSDLQKLEMPGTNLHSYENVNPIYLEKVKLEEIGEARDDDDSLDDNAVGTVQHDQYGEQQKSMNFYTENDIHSPTDNNHLTGTEILDEALRHHEASLRTSNGNVPHQNGDTNYDTFQGLPTTQI